MSINEFVHVTGKTRCARTHRGVLVVETHKCTGGRLCSGTCRARLTRGEVRRALLDLVESLRDEFRGMADGERFSVQQFASFKDDMVRARQLADALCRCHDLCDAEQTVLTAQERTDIALSIRAPRASWAHEEVR
jgi:hypothetical protein